ncbi:hypothetical protein [Chlorobium sp.]|uniref:hypothetical protein n=1 Tax=Chlorobium sp. TaxID=1095 RepID=UPI003C69DEA4
MIIVPIFGLMFISAIVLYDIFIAGPKAERQVKKEKLCKLADKYGVIITEDDA